MTKLHDSDKGRLLWELLSARGNIRVVAGRVGMTYHGVRDAITRLGMEHVLQTARELREREQWAGTDGTKIRVTPH